MSDPNAKMRRSTWWLLPLIVLIVLLGIIYMLSHLSTTDSEMYPTTMLRQGLSSLRLC
jgi:uncharacterized membrane protein YhaH (DUF805 family)